MKVLIIEDNPNVLAALSQGLKYKSVIAENSTDGDDGLEKLIKKSYDLAILDLDLPGKDGEEILKAAKLQGVQTPILILTANEDVTTRTRLLEAGAEDFISKPYSFEELFARMKAILRRSASSFPSEYLASGDLELLPERRMAVRGDQKIELRGKEYELLSYLMSHPNKIITRQTLMEEVWGYATSVLSNTVDAHISNLRNKIDKGFEKKLIKTVHGLGYMFDTEE
ncbi:MAG: response regulator transcription factor [Candidatus Peregrinibacteria bacterium]|nr:response regulator transcription factor [Candidatus Peregrinibacteria bacterium]